MRLPTAAAAVLAAASTFACGASAARGVSEATPPTLAVDPELRGSIERLERMYALNPRPIIAAVLAIAYEHVDRTADARRMLARYQGAADDAPQQEVLRSRIAALEARLAARDRGEPREDDPELRRWLVLQVAHFEEALEMQRRGQVDCCY